MICDNCPAQVNGVAQTFALSSQLGIPYPVFVSSETGGHSGGLGINAECRAFLLVGIGTGNILSKTVGMLHSRQAFRF
jgi:hypothetical protein